MPEEKSLLERTRALLEKDKRNLREIAEAAKIGYFWLRRFKRGDYRSPGVLNVEALYAELSK